MSLYFVPRMQVTMLGEDAVEMFRVNNDSSMRKLDLSRPEEDKA